MADTGKILLDHFLSEREKDTFIPELSLVALDRARAMGYGAVFLGGDPKLYGRFGFEPSYKYGINHVKASGTGPMPTAVWSVSCSPRPLTEYRGPPRTMPGNRPKRTKTC